MARNKKLTEWLEKIGAEECAEASIGRENPVTNFEALARLVWRQSLGYVETRTDAQGNVISQQVHSPDRASQAIVLERLEGKPAIMDGADPDTPKVLERLSEMIVKRLNEKTEEIVNDNSNPKSES